MIRAFFKASAPKRGMTALVAFVVLMAGVKFADAQFISPTCVPPDCNPQVIQNIHSSDPPQTADFHISGDGGVGNMFMLGTQTPLLDASAENLFYGNVSGSSTAGSLLLLQNGAVDMFRVGLNGFGTFSGDLDVQGGDITNTTGALNLTSADGTDVTISAPGTGDVFLGSGDSLTVPGDLVVSGTVTGGDIATASGTADRVAKFTTSDTLGDSQITDDGTNVGIGTTSPAYDLDVSGTARFTSGIGTGGFAPSTSYGIRAQGSTGGGYFRDTGGVYTRVAYGSWGIYTPYSAYFGGNVGLGTSPSNRLSVSGNADISGTLTVGALSVSGSDVCLQDGTNCPPDGDSSSTNELQDLFRTINAPGGTDPVADTTADTLNLANGAGISVTGDSGSDTITITNTGDTNAGDDVTGLNAGTGISVSGSAPTLTVTNTGDTDASDDITGSGSTGYLPRFTGTRTVGNSNVYDTGSSVGIGTNGPDTELHVLGGGDAGSTGSGGVAKFQQSSGGKYILIDENEIQGYNNDGSPHFLHLNTDGGTVVLQNGSSGNVGVGTPNPSEKLHVNGGALFSSGIGTGGFSPSSSYGIRAQGSTMGGRFDDTSSSSYYTYIQYGGWGVYSPNSSGYFGNDLQVDDKITNYGTSGPQLGFEGDNADQFIRFWDYSSQWYSVGYDRSWGQFHITRGSGVGSNNDFVLDYDYGYIGINTNYPSYELEVNGSAAKTTGSYWTSISDGRLKDVHGDVTEALDIIEALRPVTYEWNDLHDEQYGENKGLKYGFVAQEVQDVLPEFIKEDEDGYLWLDPSGYEAIMTAAVQEQQAEIGSLRSHVEDLEKRLERLEAR